MRSSHVLWVTTRVSHPGYRKGQAKPISVVVKMRQGRKAATLLTGFEQYLLNAEEIAEELRKLCASSTSGSVSLFLPSLTSTESVVVGPLPGKSSDSEVMVQGQQIKVVTDFLISKGVPKRWIESSDTTHKKKR